MLVSKKITLHAGDPAVEILAGEETEQSYELWISANGPIWLGDASVSQTASAGILGVPLRLRGVSLWVVGPSVSSQNVDVTVLAYSSGD